MRNALLVNPLFPPSYWSYAYALEFVDKKSNIPPLGLLTVAAMFPDDWSLRLVDMNIRPLRDEDLAWADAVFTSSMIVQQESLVEVVRRCRQANVPVIAGGPHPTALSQDIQALFEPNQGIDHFVLGEVEAIFSSFLDDLRGGRARPVYGPAEKPDVDSTAPPRFDLIDPNDYGSMALQFSRGCPFDCEFCDITALYGRRPRTKSPQQMIAELEAVYRSGWRGSVFLVDDNFIGHRRAALHLLEAVSGWQEARGHPFSFMTEASVDLARNPKLLEAMRACGFTMVFLGIESPREAALEKTSKGQNLGRGEAANHHLQNAVRLIQEHGIEVSGGFIIGLDGDDEFDSHLAFVREAGIPMAMTGLLTALKGTRLHERLEREGRLRSKSTGCNTEIDLNFEPELPRDQLLREYRRVIRTLYEPSLRGYFQRCLTLFEHLAPRRNDARTISRSDLLAALRSLRRQLFSRQGPAYARFLFLVVRHHREHLAEAFRLAIKGYHFERITNQQLLLDTFERRLAREREAPRTSIPTREDTALQRDFASLRARLDPAFSALLDKAMTDFCALDAK